MPIQSEPTDRLQAEKANAAGWNTPFIPLGKTMSELPELTIAQRTALAHVARGTGRIRHVYRDGATNVYRNTVRIAGHTLHKLEALGLISDTRGQRSTGSGEDSYTVSLTAKGQQVFDAYYG